MQADILSILPLDILYAVPALRLNVLLRLPRVLKVSIILYTSKLRMCVLYLVNQLHDLVVSQVLSRDLSEGGRLQLHFVL